MPDGHRPGLLTRTVSPWLLKILRERLSEDQLRALVAANVHLGGDERRIIDDVWDSGNSLIREVMVPRPDVIFLDLKMSGLSGWDFRIRSTNPVADGSRSRCYLEGEWLPSKPRVARLKTLASSRC